ncbi:hypothetical protein D9M69_640710 [compost metagenome]
MRICLMVPQLNDQVTSKNRNEVLPRDDSSQALQIQLLRVYPRDNNTETWLVFAAQFEVILQTLGDFVTGIGNLQPLLKPTEPAIWGVSLITHRMVFQNRLAHEVNSRFGSPTSNSKEGTNAA